MNQKLLQPVEEWKVRNAFFGLGTHKAPDPDGLNGLFYQKHWEMIKGDVVDMVRNFFEQGILHSSINETHIVLIPKIPRPEEVSRFRPISSCNFIYKVISKVIADRMKASLQGLISDSQSAFVNSRQIQDHVIIARDFS